MNINAPLSIRRRMGLEIFRRLENERTEEHQLKQLFWECTLRCNLHCRHCGSDCKKIAGHPDMPKEDFLRVLDSVSAQNDPHKIFVIITGGEPLMRKDLEECGRAIYERGFPWGMVTNGLLTNAKCYHVVNKYIALNFTAISNRKVTVTEFICMLP